MIKAVIFDFDGVVVDSEPVHFKVFQQVLKDEGIDLEKTLYVSRYLAFDDKTFFKESLNDFGKHVDNKQIEELIEKKTEIFESLIEGYVKVFPGVEKFLHKIKGLYPVAIGSGALRSEIEIILKQTGLEEYFDFIVSADEVENCKPAPEVYIKVLKQLNKINSKVIEPSECLVFEDAIHGIQAAKAAGMQCVAVTNSYKENELGIADLVINSFEEIDQSFFKKFS